MLRWIFLALAVVVMVAGATFVSLNATITEPTAVPAAPAHTGPSAKVEIPEPLIYEFGTMAQLTTGTHAWSFKNVGDADLELWFEKFNLFLHSRQAQVGRRRGKEEARHQTQQLDPDRPRVANQAVSRRIYQGGHNRHQ